MSKRFTWLPLVLLMVSVVALAKDNSAPASAPATTQPAATEWTMPQQDDITVLLPAGDKIYCLCADNNKEKQVPGEPPVRKRWTTYMCFDTKTGSLSNMLLTIPEKFDPDKLMVFGFVLSPDRKFALMDVNSPDGSNLAGLYIVDLAAKKAKKFLPGGDAIWMGKELIQNVKDNQSRYTQPMRYSTTGARLGPLPICGVVRAADEEGKNLCVWADPRNLKKPLPEIGSVATPLMVDKKGKVTSDITAQRGVFSPNLKFYATQAIFKSGLNPKGGANMEVFSLDGKKDWILPEVMKVIYVGDEGDVLSISYAPVNGELGRSTLTYWDANGKKVWSGPQVSTAAFYDGKVYYVETVKSKVMIKTKTLVEKK